MSREGRTAVLTLASDKVNSLDREVFDEISTFVRFCEEDPGVGALVLTGAGNVFSAGLNVSEILANEKSYTDALLDALSATFADLFRCPLPTVAAVNGAAIAGGCLLACACDKRLIADEARIGVTELKVGVAFPTVAVELLKHVAGPHAEQLILDAGLLDAEDACRHRIGPPAPPSSRTAGGGHGRGGEAGLPRCRCATPWPRPPFAATPSRPSTGPTRRSTGWCSSTGGPMRPGPVWGASWRPRAECRLATGSGVARWTAVHPARRQSHSDVPTMSF